MNCEILKNKTNFLQWTGGTFGLHRRNPTEGSESSVGPNLVFQKNALAEPLPRFRRFRQSQKMRQSHVLTRETIFKFFENS